LACSISVVVLGDESGYLDGENQKMKVASIEAEWKTERRRRLYRPSVCPTLAARKTHAAIKIPWALGLIATRSIDRRYLGIFDLVARARARIVTGMEAYSELQLLRVRPTRRTPNWCGGSSHQTDLGYGLLLAALHGQSGRLRPPEQIDAAAWSACPTYPFCLELSRDGRAGPVLTSRCLHRVLSPSRTLRPASVVSQGGVFQLAPAVVAVELGWIVSEYGRQPWAVEGVLPTFLVSRELPWATCGSRCRASVVFYSALAVVDAYLLTRTIRRDLTDWDIGRRQRGIFTSRKEGIP